MGIHIMNYLDDWLVLARSEQKRLIHRSLLLSQCYSVSWAENQFSQELSVSQPVGGLSKDSYRCSSDVGLDCVRMLTDNSADFSSPQSFSEDPQPPPLCSIGIDLQREGSHDRYLQLRLGSTVHGTLVFSSWASLEQHLHINCLEMLRVFLALKTALPALRRCHTWQINKVYHDGEMPPSMGTVHSALIKGNPRGGQTEPGSGCAVPGQYSSRRMETKSPRGSKDLVCLLEGRGVWSSWWRNQMWFPELIQLILAAPWPVPLRKDILSQARGMI
ncbi:hypothetical protein H4Q32_011547 [Labeo rohita]|uniref:Reverse transcriptase domain-containing protein n=1 Tax=Labeo rohita TaxID=84645 RepID=A0ABQ8LVT8_LABRO|nr:hypothetical protein H4Q32_011547 [Labeo rohita]